MAQSDKQIKNSLESDGEAEGQQSAGPMKAVQVSRRVSDHLANERTFLAWMRTGLATIAFGFVVERFGLLLRELGVKGISIAVSFHYSTFFGVALTLLGVIMMIVALMNFLHIRRAIDQEEFHPRAWYAIVLTVLASIIGLLLAIYLLLTG
jgi:putative membrane protein